MRMIAFVSAFALTIASSVAFMRGSRAGAFRFPAQLQVLRTGCSEARRPATALPPPRDAIIVGD
jgi:hypothetical protein